MIWDNPVLDRLIEQETFARIIAKLTPCEMAVALLRADGMDDQEIADALGITRSGVQARIKQAMTRIASQMPEGACLLAGRSRFNTASRHLTFPGEGDMLPCPEVARLLSCSNQTIRNWIAAGRFPGARQVGRGLWLIPWADLEELL